MPVARAIGKGALVAGIAALIIIVIAVVALHTEWARDEIRDRLASALSESIAGSVTIGDLDGAPLDQIVLRDVTLRDPNGDHVAHAAWIAIDYAPLPLLFGDFVAESIAVQQITLWLRPLPSGTLNLTAALESVGPRDEQGARISIERLTVAGGQVFHPTVSVREIEASSKVQVAGENMRIDVLRARAMFPALRGNLVVSARGQVRRDATWLTVENLVATSNGASMVAPAIVRSHADGAVAGVVLAAAAPKFLARLSPAVPWPKATRARALVTSAGTSSPIRIRVLGQGGQARLRGNAVVTREPLAITADAALSGQILGLDIQRATASASYRDAVLEARADAAFPRGAARGRATINFGGDVATVRSARFSATIPELGVAFPDANVAGSATARANARGPISALTARARITIGDLRLGSIDIGEARANLRVDGRSRRARARIHLGSPQSPYAATIAARARLGALPIAISLPRLDVRTRGIRWRGNARLTASSAAIRIRQLAIRSAAGSIDTSGIVRFAGAKLRGRARVTTSLKQLSRAFAIPVAMSGDMTANATFRGAVSRPEAEVDVTSDRARIGDINIDSITAHASLSPNAWSLRAAIDQARGGTLSATGEGGWHPEDVRGHITVDDFDLSVLTPVLNRAQDTVVRVAGIVDGELFVTSPVTQASRGWLEIRRGRIDLAEKVRPIRNMYARASLAGGTLSVEMNAQSGEGKLSFSAAGIFRQRVLRRFSIAIDATDFPFIAGSTRTIVDVNAQVRGERTADLIRADVTIESGTLRIPDPGDERDLHGTGDLEDVVFVEEVSSQRATQQLLAAVASPPDRVLRAHIVAPNGIEVNANGRADARVNVDVVATLAGGELFVTGAIDAVSGWVALFERRYEILRGRMFLEGALPPDPRLDFLVMHQFDEMTLFVDIEGTFDDPEVTLSATPSTRTPAELLGIVLGGEPYRTNVRSLEGEARVAASALLTGAIESVIEDRLPVDAVRVGAGDDLDGGIAYVAVGEWITDDIFVAYRRRFDADQVGFQENENEAAIEWHFFENWMVEGRFGDEGVGAADILWIKRFDARSDED